MTKKQEKTFWDTFHSDYQMGPAKHRQYLLDRMEDMGVESFLDVGCGTGPLYELCVKDYYKFKYKGTDYSWAMIEQAQYKFPKGDWEVQDARKLKEKDKSWDCVVLMHCLDHLDDHASAIAEATRVAKRYVIIILWRPFIKESNINSVNRMHKPEGEEPWEDTHLHDYSRKDLFHEIRKNGLRVVDEIRGKAINDPGKYNWMVILEKQR